jgi:hypothetical protein
MAQRRDGDGLRSTAAGVGARPRHHHRKFRPAAEREERAPREPLIGEANARETLEESGNGELGLEPPKRRAQGEVRATLERAMVHTLANRRHQDFQSYSTGRASARNCLMWNRRVATA